MRRAHTHTHSLSLSLSLSLSHTHTHTCMHACIHTYRERNPRNVHRTPARPRKHRMELTPRTPHHTPHTTHQAPHTTHLEFGEVFETLFRILVPEVKGAIGARGAKRTMLLVEADCIHCVDVLSVCARACVCACECVLASVCNVPYCLWKRIYCVDVPCVCTCTYARACAHLAGRLVTVALEGKVFVLLRVADVIYLCSCALVCERAHVRHARAHACEYVHAHTRANTQVVFGLLPSWRHSMATRIHARTRVCTHTNTHTLSHSSSLSLSSSPSLSLSQTWTRPSIDPIAYPRLSLKSEMVRIYAGTHVVMCVCVNVHVRAMYVCVCVCAYVRVRACVRVWSMAPCFFLTHDTRGRNADEGHT